MKKNLYFHHFTTNINPKLSQLAPMEGPGRENRLVPDLSELQMCKLIYDVNKPFTFCNYKHFYNETYANHYRTYIFPG